MSLSFYHFDNTSFLATSVSFPQYCQEAQVAKGFDSHQKTITSTPLVSTQDENRVLAQPQHSFLAGLLNNTIWRALLYLPNNVPPHTKTSKTCGMPLTSPSVSNISFRKGSLNHLRRARRTRREKDV
jgi:hypothetical protein